MSVAIDLSKIHELEGKGVRRSEIIRRFGSRMVAAGTTVVDYYRAVYFFRRAAKLKRACRLICSHR